MAGFGWPYANLPGVVVVVGEDFEPDNSLPYSPRHFHLLDVFESSNMEDLFRKCMEVKSAYHTQCVWGDVENQLNALFREMSKTGGHFFLLNRLKADVNLNTVIQLIRLNTIDRKTFHFGDHGHFRGHLTGLTGQDLEEIDIEKRPALYALGCVLIDLAFKPYQGGFSGCDLS